MASQGTQTSNIVTNNPCTHVNNYQVKQNPKCQLDGCKNDADSDEPQNCLGFICSRHRTYFNSLKCFRKKNLVSDQVSVPQISTYCSLQWFDELLLCIDRHE
jgi:hypothetical protein